jgi:hypothetical protein
MARGAGVFTSARTHAPQAQPSNAPLRSSADQGRRPPALLPAATYGVHVCGLADAAVHHDLRGHVGLMGGGAGGAGRGVRGGAGARG